MDDPAADFFEREKRELGDLSDELNLNEDAENQNDFYNQQYSEESFIENENSDSSKREKFEPPKTEPEKIKIWREEFKNRIESKDKVEKEKIDSLEMAAARELQDWGLRYREQLKATFRHNREENTRLLREQNKADGGRPSDFVVSDAVTWESVCRMSNFRQASLTTAASPAGVVGGVANSVGSVGTGVGPVGVGGAGPGTASGGTSTSVVLVKDTARMRELLLSLQHSPPTRSSRS